MEVYQEPVTQEETGGETLGEGDDSDSSGQEETLTIPTLLVRFLSQRNESGQMFSQILSMTPGYRFSGSRPFTLTPVWHFSTDTGEYLLSALDGSLLFS